MIDQYLDYLRTYRSQRTVDTYRPQLARWQAFSTSDSITYETFKDFVDHLRSEGLSDGSINSHLRSLKAYLNWCHKYLNHQKFHVPMLKVNKKIPKVWTTHQLEIIETILNHRAQRSRRYQILRRTHYMLRYTGMRAGELFHLNWSDIGSGIRIEGKEDWTTKNKQDSILPIHPKLLEFLQIEKHEGETNYLDHHFKELSHLTYSMRKFQKSIDLDGPKPLHGYRASVATELLSGNMNPVHVQHLLRHERLSTTELYLNTTHLPLQELVNSLGIYREDTEDVTKTMKWPERESNLRHTDFQSLEEKLDKLLQLVQKDQ
jgi:integrase